MQDIKAKYYLCMQETGAFKLDCPILEETVIWQTVAAISKQSLVLALKQHYQFYLSLYYYTTKFQSSFSFLLCTIILSIDAGVVFTSNSDFLACEEKISTSDTFLKRYDLNIFRSKS